MLAKRWRKLDESQQDALHLMTCIVSVSFDLK